MTTLGTWSDALIVQAVSDAFNITINIIESNERFAPYTVIQPVNFPYNSPSIFIVHVDEMHYVSTIPLRTELPPLENYEVFIVKRERNFPDPNAAYSDAKKQKRNLYMRNYMRKAQKQKSLEKK